MWNYPVAAGVGECPLLRFRGGMTIVECHGSEPPLNLNYIPKAGNQKQQKSGGVARLVECLPLNLL